MTISCICSQKYLIVSVCNPIYAYTYFSVSGVQVGMTYSAAIFAVPFCHHANHASINKIYYEKCIIQTNSFLLYLERWIVQLFYCKKEIIRFVK